MGNYAQNTLLSCISIHLQFLQACVFTRKHLEESRLYPYAYVLRHEDNLCLIKHHAMKPYKGVKV
jgi:hypothetical protein